MVVLIGTSGWQYRDWRGVLYPPDCPQRLWLEEYTRRFATVESNNAFYRLPTREQFAVWRDRTPEGFVMAVKASRYLTHIKRLGDPEEPVRRLMTHAAGLGDRLGPVLLQLPPTLRADSGLLDACLACFPTDARVAVEPRHDSWWTQEVRAVLERRGAALCWTDQGSRPATPLWRTAPWGYLRFHQGLARPWPRYGRAALTHWARRIDDTWPAGADIYAYFNNDPGGAAVLDAVAFARAADGVGLRVTRTPARAGAASSR
ncbi:histidine kinase [Streptomyces albus subsp. albus]|nr:histidine kinase [Streptomyces albus subsp. albus]